MSAWLELILHRSKVDKKGGATISWRKHGDLADLLVGLTYIQVCFQLADRVDVFPYYSSKVATMPNHGGMDRE